MWRVWYLKHRVREILENKDGVGVVEIILILVVLISLVVLCPNDESHILGISISIA